MRHAINRYSGQLPVLKGMVLLANPALNNPDFQKTVILMTHQDENHEGLGIILNKPLNRTLSQIYSEYTYTHLANTPVYWGGPVDSERLIITAWHRCEKEGLFQLHFGISPDQAIILLNSHYDIEIRCFKGITSWGKGQLFAEFKASVWIPCELSHYLIENVNSGCRLWHHLLMQLPPRLLLNVGTPNNPSLN